MTKTYNTEFEIVAIIKITLNETYMMYMNLTFWGKMDTGTISSKLLTLCWMITMQVPRWQFLHPSKVHAHISKKKSDDI